MQLRITASVEKLKPGFTGEEQINGWDEISLENKVQYEKHYLQRKSLKF